MKGQLGYIIDLDMKFGIRKRSYKKSFRAMTTGRAKRAVKKQIIPLYGAKGSGWIKNPKKAAYNKVYRKTTVKSPMPYLGSKTRSTANHKSSHQDYRQTPNLSEPIPETIPSSMRSLTITSDNFEQLKTDLTKAYDERRQLKQQLSKSKLIYYVLFIISKRKKRTDRKTNINQLIDAVANAFIDLKFRENMKDPGAWDECYHYFNQLMESDKVWDLTSRQNTNKYQQRTVANESIDRKPLGQRSHKKLDFIETDADNLYLPNLNGADLYVYPTFIVMFKNYKNFAIHDLQQIDITLKAQGFHEEEKLPSDAIVVGETYKYTNKNGTPDKRFQNNYSIPVTKYGDLSFQSKSGINDRYMFSNFEAFTDFAKSLNKHASVNLDSSTGH